MDQPTPPSAEANRSVSSPTAGKPNGRHQYSLRTLCKVVVVVAVLLALPGLTELLPWPLPTFLKIVFCIGIAVFWFAFVLVTVEYVFTYMLFRRRNWPSPWPWLEMAAIALLSLLPVISFVARHHGERQLPNGYQIVSWEYSDDLRLADFQGRQVLQGQVIEWSVEGDIVRGEFANGSFFVLDTATGEKHTSEDLKEIRQFAEGCGPRTP